MHPAGPRFTQKKTMIAIDLRTVVLMSSVMPGLMSVVLFLLRRSFPSSIRGLGYWAAGGLVVCIAAVLLAWRGAIPDGLSIVLANSLILAGLGLWLIGCDHFLARKPSWIFVIATVIAGAACLAWMLWVRPDYAGRLICMSGLLTLLYGVATWRLLRHGGRDSNTVFLAVMFGIQAVSAAVRFVTSFVPGLASKGFFVSDPVQTLYFAVSDFMALMVTVGFVVAATSRLRLQLELLSATDHLTGLLNRRAFANVHGIEQQRMKQSGGMLALLIIDLDHFKDINDRHGHAMGDRVLVDFSDRVASQLEAPGYFARLGGEEFAVLLPGCDATGARVRAEQIRRLVEQKTDDALPPYTCSIGVACLAGADATMERLSHLADAALYRAKSGGRNRIEPSDPRVSSGQPS
jgi:diguanylate cyclase (GGDEF)-like protein